MNLTAKQKRAHSKKWAHMAIRRDVLALLRQLAGDTPISAYIYSLVLKEMENKQSGLRGLEHAVSKATLPAIASDLGAVHLIVAKIEADIAGYFGLEGIPKKEAKIKRSQSAMRLKYA